MNIFIAEKATADHKFDDLALSLVKDVYDFKFKSVETQISKGTFKELSNLDHDLIVYQAQFYKAFLSEQRSDQEIMENFGKKILHKIDNGFAELPLSKFYRSEVILRSALIKIKNQQYLTGAKDVHKAYKLLESGYHANPTEFIYLKNLGLLHACIGAVPEDFKWIISFLGFSGSVNQGLQELEYVLLKLQDSEFKYIYGPEVICLTSFLEATLTNDELRSSSRIDIWNATNYSSLTGLMKINLLSKFGYNDKAITSALLLRKRSTEYPIYYLDYLIGASKLFRLDDDAFIFLENYVYGFRGNSLVKSACQKLAWDALINKKTKTYNYWMRECSIRGNTFTDEDKEAEREALSGIQPNIHLLKSRLLFDGGYYSKSLDLLSGINTSIFNSDREKLEYKYRVARATHELLMIVKAKALYLSVIESGKDQPYYFAANSSLKLGDIFLLENDTSQALKYYKLCIKLPKKEYRNSLDQKAKANISLLSSD